MATEAQVRKALEGVMDPELHRSLIDLGMVREVRITISARVSAPNLQGETTSEGGPDAVRGQLTTVVAPRAALNELQMGGQIQ